MANHERVWGSTGDIDEPDAGKVEDGHDDITPPKHDWENWIKNLFSLSLRSLQRNGVIEWDAAVPYKAGASTLYSGSYYFALTATTGNQPNTSPTQWQPVAAPGGVAATTTRAGISALATNAEVQAGSSTTKTLTPSVLAARTATETRTGLAEIATTAEVTAGSDDTRIVTPSKFAARLQTFLRQATTTATGFVELATTAETQAGSSANLVVTPQALASVTATETRAGLAEIATQAETNAGSDDARFVTPAKLRAGFASSFATNGYIAFPTWLGGFIVEWGLSGSASDGGTVGVTFPLTFPTACYSAVAVPTASGGAHDVMVTSLSASSMNLQHYDNSGGAASTFRWVAIGV